MSGGKSADRGPRRPILIAPIVAVLCAALMARNVHAATATVSYAYDQVGRVITARYDNGVCVIYTYDVNGNRTTQTNTNASGPTSSVWGTGTWGCFPWKLTGSAALSPDGAKTRMAASGARRRAAR